MPVNIEAKTNLSLLDLARRMDPDGKPARIVEMLNKTNEVLQDMVTIEGNLPNGHQTTVRMGLPQTGWKILYKGTPASKSITSQVTDSSGILEAYSEVDEDVITLNGNTNSFRLSESQAFLEVMNQEMTRALFYANTAASPEQPMGLAMRYNTLNPDVPISENVLDAGGEEGDDLTSIWLICWGDKTIHAFYPKGSELGLQHNDMGKEPREFVDDDGVHHKYYAFVDQYKWKLGFCVPDWRYGVRICNVPLNKLKEKSQDIIDLMIEAEERIAHMSSGRPAWYMNKRVKTMLRQGILRIPNVETSFDTVAGHELTRFDGIPIRKVDALSLKEDRVLAATL